MTGLRSPSTRQSDDVAELCAFFEALSPVSRYYRFFSMACPNAEGSGAFHVSERGKKEPRWLASSAIASSPLPGTAGTESTANARKLTFAIADRLQGRGIGTRVLERLADVARPAGIRVFDAYRRRTGNHKMMESSSIPGIGCASYRAMASSTSNSRSIRPSNHLEKAAHRSQLAATASMKPFFEPRTVAVVGANRERGHIGSEIFHNLLATGFTGSSDSGESSRDEIGGLRAYRRVATFPGGRPGGDRRSGGTCSRCRRRLSPQRCPRDLHHLRRLRRVGRAKAARESGHVRQST